MAKRSKLSLFFAVILVILLGCGGYLLFQDTTSPEIVLSHKSEYVAPNLSITVTVTDVKSAVKNINVIVRHNEKVIPVAESSFSDGAKTQKLTFTLEKTGLKDSTFDLEVTAADASLGGFGRGNKITQIYPMRIDTTPPRISMKSTTPYMRRGGTGCAVYSITKDVQQTGVKVGAYFFPAFRQANGDYLCFFAFPYFMETKEYQPQVVAVDVAGNTQVSELSVSRIHRQFKTDTIDITPGFLNDKAVEFEAIVPGPMPDIDRFLKVNGDVRKSNALTLMEIGKNTAPEMLWKGAFLRMPKAASRAGFADHRTYKWEGKKVDEQTHLGFDLAALKNSAVPASNSGKVVYTGYLGIYGNLIVIDHGLGMQSLYSHLSEIHVQADQVVAKGDIIGKTGATGMAGGDHLHFGILISGLEVTPLEWLDDHWIKDNIIDRINAAGTTAPEFAVTTPEPEKANTPPPAKRQTTTPAKRSRR